jgi:hypothetical protein
MVQQGRPRHDRKGTKEQQTEDFLFVSSGHIKGIFVQNRIIIMAVLCFNNFALKHRNIIKCPVVN